MARDGEQAFEAQVERVRASGWLGRSASLSRLFDFLAEARKHGRSLREIEVAQEVFGRATDLSGDASVRVYVHRLRKKLADFYDGPGAGEPHRLILPLGEYRLDLERPPEVEPASPAAQPRAARRWGLAAALAALLVANLLAWLWIGAPWAGDGGTSALARRAPWSMIDGRRPVVIVVGDYYIFGEADGPNVKRMIREFDINSPEDLSALLMRSPALQDRYVDLDTDYTPTGATLALKDVLPVVRAAAKDPSRVRIVTSSMLTPAMLKTDDIVYVGYLSGLRLLERAVFADARLGIGESYDELYDRRTGRNYMSNAAIASASQANVDYGYLRALEGPAGNHILVIAGTRDIGVMQMAELAVAPDTKPSPRDAKTVERLFEVRGVGRTNISAREVNLDAPR